MSSNLCTYIAWVRSIKRSQVIERASRNESVKFTFNMVIYFVMQQWFPTLRTVWKSNVLINFVSYDNVSCFDNRRGEVSGHGSFDKSCRSSAHGPWIWGSPKELGGHGRKHAWYVSCGGMRVLRNN